MKFFTEREGMTRRQFFKGAGTLTIAAVFLGAFSKLGFDAFAASTDYIEKRAAGLYSLDEKMTIRKSHENPEVAQIYKEFLSPGEIKPGTEKSELLLHTKYGKDIPEFIDELKNKHEAA